MSDSFLSIFGGSQYEASSESGVEKQTSSLVESILDFIKGHKMFITLCVVLLLALIYVMYRGDNTDVIEEDKLKYDKTTDELVDDLKLDLNLTKNVKQEHLTLSSDDEDDEEDDDEDVFESQKKKEIKGIDEVSNDLKELEEYTQESMDS